MLEKLAARGFEIEFHSHARAILSQDFPEALAELDEVFSAVAIPISEIIGSGGGEAAGTQRMRRALADKGWEKVNFEIEKIVNGVKRASISHEIDHVKSWDGAGTLALEIEWNNKDPFFDRDLENFKRLHAEGAISAGIIVTRGASLQAELKSAVLRFARENRIASFDDLVQYEVTPTRRQRGAVEARVMRGTAFEEAWSSFFVSDKFGEATTHWRKLQDRVHRGVGNPCPLLLIGLPAGLITF
ncbi:MAG: BglII/BstYI family type II restriction endonuclease [Alphaproteobacteria bacterium]